MTGEHTLQDHSTTVTTLYNYTTDNSSQYCYPSNQYYHPRCNVGQEGNAEGHAQPDSTAQQKRLKNSLQ